MYKSIDVDCDKCRMIYTILVDVPSGSSLPPFAKCEVCGEDAKRLITFTIAKAQIEERTHGGTVIGGKVVRRDTGMSSVVEQAALTRRMKKARKNGDAETAREVHKELTIKQQEAAKKL